MACCCNSSAVRFCKLPCLEILRTDGVKNPHDTHIQEQEHTVGKEPGGRIGIADGGEAEAAHKAKGNQSAGNQPIMAWLE